MKMKNRFFGIVNDIPLNFKFLIIYAVCLLIPILVINAVFFDRFSRTVDEREQNNYQISLERARTDIESIIEGCIAVSHSISTDRVLYSLLDKSFESNEEYYESYDSVLRNRLNAYSDVYDYIGGLKLYVDNPTISNGGTYYLIDKDIKDSAWYEAVKSSKQRVLVKAYIGHTGSLPIRQIPFLSVLRSFPEDSALENREKILKIDIDLERISSILKRETEYLNLYLVDPDNNIVCSSAALYDFNRVQDFIRLDSDILGKDNLLLETAVGNTGYLSDWRLVGEANMTRISNATRDTLNFVLPLAGACVLISSLLILIIVRSYNYRLRKLSKHLLKLNDDRFDLIEINEGKDEIGDVIKNFNLMAVKINNLINDVYKLELQKKNLELERVRAELNYLQSQMNPHFLFNTLNALMVVSVKKNYTDIADVLKYLSKTLRRLLSWKDDIVSIKEEIHFTEMFLKIEKFRFTGKFEYTIDVEPHLLSCEIPKLSLQPLVENACVHGIQAIKGAGMIHIRIAMGEDALHVCVEDNGTGMDEKKLAELMRNVKSNEEISANIGIRNVYRRLLLYYGDDVSFDIESRVNGGTTVSFAIPAEKLQFGETI
jgi:two-component system sensor histidine kinase YesM